MNPHPGPNWSPYSKSFSREDIYCSTLFCEQLDWPLAAICASFWRENCFFIGLLFHEIFCQPKSCSSKFKFLMALKNLRNLINLDQTNLETLGDKKRWLCWCWIAGRFFWEILGDRFSLELCFFDDSRGRWIIYLSKAMTRHFLGKTLLIYDPQFLKQRFLKTIFIFLIITWQSSL